MNARRFWKGFAAGVIATVAMSVLMIAGVLSGLSPMPQPIPAALVGTLTEGTLARPVLMTVAAILHLTYGGFWGGVLARATRPVTIAKGLGLGALLWLLMQIVVLPIVGWGLFGLTRNGAIAIATLVLHLVYGFTLGVLLDRSGRRRVAD